MIKRRYDHIKQLITSQNQMSLALARMKRMEQETEQEFIGLQTGIPGETSFFIFVAVVPIFVVVVVAIVAVVFSGGGV